MSAQLVLFCAGINLANRKLLTKRRRGYFQSLFISRFWKHQPVCDYSNFVLGTVVITQFMNNIACAGVSWHGLNCSCGSIWTDPRAIVMQLRWRQHVTYLTPMASGKNQLIMPFNEFKIPGFSLNLLPLLISPTCVCVLILPDCISFF